MKAKFSYLVSGLLGLMFAVALTASAQDEMPGPSGTNLFNQDPAVYDEKPLLLEQEKFRSPMDSLQHLRALPTSPAKQKSADPKKPQAEGDPLNFNFLYYIIQKFKGSELMME